MRDVPAEIMGYNSRWVWLRVPYHAAHRILTLPRAKLKRGFATAKEVLVDIDYRTLRFEHGYFAEVEITQIVSTASPTEAMDPA